MLWTLVVLVLVLTFLRCAGAVSAESGASASAVTLRGLRRHTAARPSPGRARIARCWTVEPSGCERRPDRAFHAVHVHLPSARCSRARTGFADVLRARGLACPVEIAARAYRTDPGRHS